MYIQAHLFILNEDEEVVRSVGPIPTNGGTL
jgi:hypothetical protein